MSKSGNGRIEQASAAYEEHLRVTREALHAKHEAEQNTEQALRLRAALEVHLADWAARMGFTVYDLETSYFSTRIAGDGIPDVYAPHAFGIFRGVCGEYDWDMISSYEAGQPIYVRLSHHSGLEIVDDISFGRCLKQLQAHYPHMLLSRRKRDKLARKRGDN